METQPGEGFEEALQETKATRRSGSIDEIVSRLDRAYSRDWINHLSAINEKLIGKDLLTRQNRARALSTYKVILELKNDSSTKFKLVDIHRAVSTLQIDKPRLTTYNKFEEFINRGPGRSYQELLDYLNDKPRGVGNTKVGDGLKTLIIAFYAQPIKLNFSRIAELASHAVRKTVQESGIDSAIEKWNLPNSKKVRDRLTSSSDYISAATVKKLVTPEVRNTYYRKRHGLKEFRQNQVTPIFRKRAQFPLDRVEIDSTVFSFLFHDSDTGKYSIRLTTCILVDSFSGRIIGYAFAKSESSNLILSALRTSFSSIGFLPAEIFSDRFPGHNNKEIEYFLKQLDSLGCKVNFERTGNARAKGLVEVTINNLCELAKECPQFVGKNITTKSLNSRKSVEVISQMTKIDNRLSLEAVKGQLIELFAFYNSRKPGGRDYSRSDLFFKSSGFTNAIELSIENKIWLFYKVTSAKVNQGCIIFRDRLDRYVYPISDPTVRLRTNGIKVRVRYREEDLILRNEIWLFDEQTDELICSCVQQTSPMVAKANQTEIDKNIYRDNTKKNRGFTSIIKQKEFEIDELSIEISNHMTTNKIEQTSIEELYILQGMIGDEKVKSSGIVFEDEDGNLKSTYLIDERLKPNYDRLLLGIDEGKKSTDDDDDDELLRAIMIADSKKNG